MRVTPFAVPSPSLLTTMVKAAVSPALMVPLSAVLRTVTSGHRTSVESESSLLPRALAGSLVALTSAVFSIVPQLSPVVGLEMWTVLMALWSMVPKSQESTPLSIAQSAAPVPPTMLQLRPESDGRVSVSDTFAAAPSPMLDTVMVKPMSSPALTDSSSAVLTTFTSGQSTWVDADLESEPSLVVLTDAVLL